MRRLVAAALLALGLVLGIVLPVTGSGRLPLVLGAACLAAAGVVAAWSTRTDWSRMAWVAAAIASAVALLLVPGVVNGRRNAQGIAWTVPQGERVILAEAGVAVTRRGPTGTLTGRALDSGAQRWRLQLGDPALNIGQLTAQRVGGMLILLDADGVLRGVELATGKVRWQAEGARAFPIAVATRDAFALLRCGQPDRCRVEAHAAADGRLRWDAPASAADRYLGAPHTAASVVPWPASVALLRTGKRYTVRDLASGRVLRRGNADGEANAVTGTVVVHAVFAGPTWAEDAVSGRELWRRPADEASHPVRNPGTDLGQLGLADESLVLTKDGEPLPSLTIGDSLRLVDARTGRLTEHANRLDDQVEVVPSGRRGAPVLFSIRGDDAVQADDRVYDTPPLQDDSVAATATRVGWESAQPAFASGVQDGAEVHDRRTGRRLVRYTGKRVSIRSVGERLIITDGDRERVVAAT